MTTAGQSQGCSVAVHELLEARQGLRHRGATEADAKEVPWEVEDARGHHQDSWAVDELLREILHREIGLEQGKADAAALGADPFE